MRLLKINKGIIMVLFFGIQLINCPHAEARFNFFGLFNIDVEIPSSIDLNHHITLNDDTKKFIESMPPSVRKEFENAINTIFKNNIEPLIGDIDLMMKNRIGDVNEILKKRLDQVGEIIGNSINQFKNANIETVEAIKTQVIDHASKKADELRTELKRDILDIIDQLDCLENKARRDIESLYATFKRDISITWFSSLPPCFKEVGITKFPESSEYLMIYELMKCEKLRELSPKTPVRTILNTYGDLKALAWRTACIQRHAGASVSHIKNDWSEFGDKYQIWWEIVNQQLQ